MKNGVVLVLIILISSLISCEKDTDVINDNNLELDFIIETAYSSPQGELVEVNLDGQKIICQRINGELIYQGDIVLVEWQLNVDSNLKGAALKSISRRWTNNIVYYQINSELPKAERISEAIVHWEEKTLLKFEERSDQDDYIEFIWDENGCSSNLGMIGGKQLIKIADWAKKGNVVHEIGHAIGLIHEHSRNDRDEYVNIDFDNIIESAKHNYYKNNAAFDYGEFDFNSIMIYPSGGGFAIDRKKPIITKLDGSSYKAQRDALSTGDIAIVADLYKNSKPTPSFTIFPNEGDINTQFVFDASATTDIDEPISNLQFRWDFQSDEIWDSEYSNENKTSYKFESAGTYSVLLEVKDSEGAVEALTKEISVKDIEYVSTELFNDDGSIESTFDWGHYMNTTVADNKYGYYSYLTPTEYPFKLTNVSFYFNKKNSTIHGFYLHVWDENGNNLLPEQIIINYDDVITNSWWEKDLSQLNISINSGKLRVGICEMYLPGGGSSPWLNNGWRIGVDESSTGQSFKIGTDAYNNTSHMAFSDGEFMIRAKGMIPSSK